MKRKADLMVTNEIIKSELSFKPEQFVSISNNSNCVQEITIHEIFPDKLQTHLLNMITRSLESWNGSLESKIIASRKFIDKLLKEEIRNSNISGNSSFLRKSVNNKVESITKMLRCKTDWDVAMFDTIDVNDLYYDHLNYKSENNNLFNNITQHHEIIKSHEWENIINDQNKMVEYAKAAYKMGEKEWVKNATKKIYENIIKFYYSAYGIKHLKKSHNINLENDQILLSNERVKLLDIGSCYNPFQQYKEFDVTAVDLCPAVDTVIKCDFLDIITSSENNDPINLGNNEYLRYFPSAYYNIAVFSLVLSYLPNPNQRLKMIINARKVLHHNINLPGLLLIHEKDSIFHKSDYFHLFLNHWKMTISKIGFTLVKYEKIISKDHHAHLLIFSTNSSTKLEEIGENNDGLWIKQDFLNNERQLDLNQLNKFFGIDINNT